MMNGHRNLQTRVQIYDRCDEDKGMGVEISAELAVVKDPRKYYRHWTVQGYLPRLQQRLRDRRLRIFACGQRVSLKVIQTRGNES